MKGVAAAIAPGLPSMHNRRKSYYSERKACLRYNDNIHAPVSFRKTASLVVQTELMKGKHLEKKKTEG